MRDPFVHLHVASGYSLRHGAATPRALVERAAELGMDRLALTDRDGVYGAVKFARACQRAGLGPVIGVDLAHRPVLPVGPRGVRAPRTPVRGGAFRDPGLPRVSVLAGPGRAGWAALCGLVSAVHLAGERGRPVLDLDRAADRLAPALAAGHLVVLLGPASELGRAATRRSEPLAAAALAPWRELAPRAQLVVELVSHRLPPSAGGQWGPGSTPHAAAMARLAHRAGLATVLANQVRYLHRGDAVTVDVLDAARRLVALDRRHVDRGNAEGFVKSGPQMVAVAEEIVGHGGHADPVAGARRLLGRTRALAERCTLDPAADLGLGQVHLPELGTSTWSGTPRMTPGASAADGQLRARCEGALGQRYGSAPRQVVWKRLDDELELVRGLGYASYFLTVGDVTDLIRARGVRCAARGSGAGSLVTYLLGISGVDPIRHQLLVERFLSPLRRALPDIDVDVESARRTEVYEAILERYGAQRCLCVSMMDTYRVRHAVRDVGAALGMAPSETDALAKAFPHLRARDARAALRQLPELRAAGWDQARLDLVLQLVERLDGLPRHIAVHPCGILLSDATLLQRTPVEASFAGFPMSQFDKDDVEELGLLKLDVLGIRMQSAMAHAVAEIARVDGVHVDVDDEQQVPLDDPATFELISQARTLGVFQLESPGQRALVATSGITSFEDIITDISLFRPGPVGSDMITPYVEAKQGWATPTYLHPDLRPILAPTHGVVVFHEQVIEIIARFARVGFAEADDRRRGLGDPAGVAATRRWFVRRSLAHGYRPAVVDAVWRVLEAFAAFGFCKAHAAAFALPTYQSAWLKTHWPAHFLAGVLTHDPGMYPKRLLLDDARRLGVAVLGLDVDRSGRDYLVEPVAAQEGGPPYGIRVALAEVRGISAAEVDRVVAARPYASLSDFWRRAAVSRPVVERRVLAGGFDAVHRLEPPAADGVRRRGRVTRRDLLLQVAALDQHSRAVGRSARGLTRGPVVARLRAQEAAARTSSDPRVREATAVPQGHAPAEPGVWARTRAQSQATPAPTPVASVQLALDLGDIPAEGEVSGLPEMTTRERTAAELEILGLDTSRHVLDEYAPFLDRLGVVRCVDLLRRRHRSELLVAGVKVATQTPPLRSGRRVVFLTVDDATGPVDATFFEDAQGPWAATVFASWLLVVRGELRRTGRRGVSVRATGCWDLTGLHATWRERGLEAVHAVLAGEPGDEPVDGSVDGSLRAGAVPRTLWHRSPGSPG